MLGHSQPLLFWVWRGVNWRDSFLHHQENKRHPGDCGGAGAGEASELLPLLFLRFRPRRRSRGFKEARCETCGLVSLGMRGKGFWILPNPGEGWGEVWQAALAGMSHQGWGWDRALDTGPTGKSRAQREGLGNVIPAPGEGRGQVLSQSSWVSAAASATWSCRICLKSWEFWFSLSKKPKGELTLGCLNSKLP